MGGTTARYVSGLGSGRKHLVAVTEVAACTEYLGDLGLTGLESPYIREPLSKYLKVPLPGEEEIQLSGPPAKKAAGMTPRRPSRHHAKLSTAPLWRVAYCPAQMARGPNLSRSDTPSISAPPPWTDGLGRCGCRHFADEMKMPSWTDTVQDYAVLTGVSGWGHVSARRQYLVPDDTFWHRHQVLSPSSIGDGGGCQPRLEMQCTSIFLRTRRARLTSTSR
jgi:hypothetical protein